MKNLLLKQGEKTRIFLSHHPKLYALIVGIGIVLFWRGVWHSADLISQYLNFFQNNLSIDSSMSLWWDGPLSLIIGTIVLFFTGAFTSSFIGNELILSGLRKEKTLSQKTEIEVKSEEKVILDIKDELKIVSEKMEELEKEIYNKNIK